MINIKDLFELAVKNMKHQKKRTALTILGIIIGIASVVALVSIGQGLSHSVEQELEKIGADKLFLQPKSAGGVGATGEDTTSKITTDDQNLVDKIVGVKQTAGLLIKTTKARFNNIERTTYFMGYPDDASEAKLVDDINTWEIEEGRMLKPGEKNKVMIGYDFANDLFEKKIQIGNKILCDGVEYKVIGIFKKMGDPGVDKGVNLGMKTLREQYNEPDSLSYIYIQTTSNDVVEDVSNRIERKMRNERDLEEGEEDFTIQTPLQMAETFTQILDIITIVLIGIAAISLLVGGIGIMNTMYTSVLERTREIGIMKSLGARNNQIMQLFLVESGLLGLGGGIIGIIIGYLTSKMVEFIAAEALGTNLLQAFFPWYLIVGALLFSFLVGTFSGVFPAKRASKLKPVDALRYE